MSESVTETSEAALSPSEGQKHAILRRRSTGDVADFLVENDVDESVSSDIEGFSLGYGTPEYHKLLSRSNIPSSGSDGGDSDGDFTLEVCESVVSEIGSKITLPLVSRKKRPPRDTSFAGIEIFKKFSLWWNAGAQRNSESVNTATETNSSSDASENDEGDKEGPSITGSSDASCIGLKVRSVIPANRYNKKLRQIGQQEFFEGRKRVAFLDEVHAVVIENMKEAREEDKQRFWYTGREYRRMVLKNRNFIARTMQRARISSET